MVAFVADSIDATLAYDDDDHFQAQRVSEKVTWCHRE